MGHVVGILPSHHVALDDGSRVGRKRLGTMVALDGDGGGGGGRGRWRRCGRRDGVRARTAGAAAIPRRERHDDGCCEKQGSQVYLPSPRATSTTHVSKADTSSTKAEIPQREADHSPTSYAGSKSSRDSKA